MTALLNSEVYRAFATFPIPLEADIPEGNQIYVLGASATNCPGQGQAEPGFLCVYQGFAENADAPNSGRILNPSLADGPDGASRFGFGIFLRSTEGGLSAVSGTFSVTAP